MTSLCKYLLLCLFLSLLSCLDFGNKVSSKIPAEEAAIIRDILNENGYNIYDKQTVDEFLEFSSTSSEVDLRDLYWLILPAETKHTIILTDNISRLDSCSNMFLSIKSYRSSNIHAYSEDVYIDSIAIITDSTIRINYLDLFNNKLQVIPKEICKLKLGTLLLNSNILTTLPDELMKITDTINYPNMQISLSNNYIDTLNLSDTLKTWLAKYAVGGENWWKLQKTYRETASTPPP